jgi:phospholipid transport system substrate-binding protein
VREGSTRTSYPIRGSGRGLALQAGTPRRGLRRGWRGGRAARVLAALVLAAAPSSADPAPAEAAAVTAIEGLHAALLDAMKRAQELGFEGRLARIGPALRERYDFPFMAEKSVGSGWKQLDETQRTRLVDAFTRLATATYAARFDGFAGERFEMLGTETASLGTILVKTQIVRGNGEKVPLDYRMRPSDGGWRIIDVFLDGTVSELALRRAEYSSVLRREGFDALLAALEEKIAAQALGGGDDERVGAPATPREG